MCQIARLVKENCVTPGIRKIYLSLKENVTSIPAATAHVVDDDIVMFGSSVFYELDFILDKGGYIDDGGAGEHAWKKTVTGFIPGAGATFKATIDKMNSAEVIAIVQQTDGDNVIVGDTEYPMRIKFKFDTKSIGGQDMPGAEFTIEGWQLNMSYHYTGVIPT